MHPRPPAPKAALVSSLAVLALALGACSGGSGSPNAPVVIASATPTPAPGATATPTPSPGATATPTPGATATPTAQPQVIHVGFQHLATTDPTYGMVAFYSPNTGNAAVIHVVANSKVVFTNDGSGVPHTASGLGTSGFPATFTNTSGATASGTTIDGGLTWSTGALQPGQTSSALTVPAGTYYFGCFYHYSSNSMRDVIVSQ